MKYFKVFIFMSILLCYQTGVNSSGYSADELQQKAVAAADLALTDVYITDDCRVHITVTNAGKVAVRNMYSVVATTANSKSTWQVRLPVDLAPKASKNVMISGCSIIGIDTVRVEATVDSMRSIQVDDNNTDKLLVRTLTCRDIKCPPGFSLRTSSSKDDFRCERLKPAKPCPEGYGVKWGPCPDGRRDDTDVSPQCSFSCIPELPKVKYDCGTNESVSTPCYTGCEKSNLSR